MNQQAPYAPGETTADVMLRKPKTLPHDATVRDARAILDNPHVQLLLLADGERFAGAITAIPPDAEPDAPTLTYASAEVDTMPPDASAADAFERSSASPCRRVVVVDDERTLLGLVCLNTRHTGFCRKD